MFFAERLLAVFRMVSSICIPSNLLSRSTCPWANSELETFVREEARRGSPVPVELLETSVDIRLSCDRVVRNALPESGGDTFEVEEVFSAPPIRRGAKLLSWFVCLYDRCILEL